MPWHGGVSGAVCESRDYYGMEKLVAVVRWRESHAVLSQPIRATTRL